MADGSNPNQPKTGNLPSSLALHYAKLKELLGNDLEARRIIEERTPYRWADIMARGEVEIAPEALKQIEQDLARRLNGEPLSRIFGTQEFWGLEFKVTKDTLDPRPETELIVELAVKRLEDNPPARILDLGTGTGCILISLLKEFPDAHGVAADISPAALRVAEENAQSHGVDGRIDYIESNWFENIDGRFDLIVSNPPYIAESVIATLESEVKNHDPILALTGGEDGLQAYKAIFCELFSHLKPTGLALFEIGFDQGGDVMRLSKESRIRAKGPHLDLAGQPRVVEISSGDK